MSPELLPAIIGMLLVAAAAAFALLPLVRGAHQPEVVALATPATERGQLYRQVLELEFDHRLGKLSDEDYRELSAGLLARAGDLLREERGWLGDLDEQIEREIAAARAAFAAARAAQPRGSAHTAEPVP